MGEASYDRLGRGYTARRGTEPRIAAAVEAALGDARSVVNVGAGTGSYEPAGREVVAVEPSAVMIAQRPEGRAPAIQASAEALPLEDDSVDAAMAIFTDHHWSDRAAGMRELRRVARERVVLVNIDPTWTGSFWLIRDYLPSFIDLVPEPYREHGYWEAELAGLLGEIEVTPIPISHDCRDGFLQAYWRRPEAYLDQAVQASISTFHVLPERDIAAALSQLRADLADGTWAQRNADLLDRDELDLGLRLVVASV
jgi:SAM-dependent methyltransferase